MIFYDLISVIFDVIVVYAVILAAFYYIKSQRQKKREVALNFISRWNDGAHQRVFSRLLSDPENIGKDIRVILYESVHNMDSQKEFKDIEAIWNFFEELSIAIVFGEADEDLAREFFFHSVRNTYHVSERAIFELREKYGIETLYKNFERLYGKWVFDEEYSLIKGVSR